MSLFPHREYHIYTTAAGIEKRHVHLTNEILAQAEYLHNFVHKKPVEKNNWRHASQLRVGDNVWLTVGDSAGYLNAPSLISYGYEGPETCRAGDFEEALFFESMIFHKCTKREGSDFDPDWDISNVRDWVDPEHRADFDEALEDYLEQADRKL